MGDESEAPAGSPPGLGFAGVKARSGSIAGDHRHGSLALAPIEPPVQTHASQDEIMFDVSELAAFVAFADGEHTIAVIIPTGQVDVEHFALEAQPGSDAVFRAAPYRPTPGVLPLLERGDRCRQCPNSSALMGPRASAGHIGQEIAPRTEGIADPAAKRRE